MIKDAIVGTSEDKDANLEESKDLDKEKSGAAASEIKEESSLIAEKKPVSSE